MMQGLGIDILAIDRFENLDNRKEFMENLFTTREIGSAQRWSRSDAVCAVYFTLKEAVLKALGCGLGAGSFWHDIDAAHADRIWGSHVKALLDKRSITKVHDSSARTKKYALSVVLLESEDKSQEVTG